MNRPDEDLALAPLTRQQRCIVDALSRSYPRPVDIRHLIDAVYANDPSGGPETAHGVVKAQLFHVRKAIVPFGWEIPKRCKGKQPAGFYRLSRISN